MKIGLVAPVKPSHPYLENGPAPLLDLHYLRISPWLWFSLMPTCPHIERHYEDLNRLIEFGGSDNELSIRPAFQTCLDACRCSCHSPVGRTTDSKRLCAANGASHGG